MQAQTDIRGDALTSQSTTQRNHAQPPRIGWTRPAGVSVIGNELPPARPCLRRHVIYPYHLAREGVLLRQQVGVPQFSRWWIEDKPFDKHVCGRRTLVIRRVDTLPVPVAFLAQDALDGAKQVAGTIFWDADYHILAIAQVVSDAFNEPTRARQFPPERAHHIKSRHS